MATVTEAIDEIVDFTDNVGTEQADQARRRERLLKILVARVKFIRYYRDWAYTRSYSAVAATVANAYGFLPADFLSIGKYGGVWDINNSGSPLDWVPESVISELRLRASTVASLNIYSLFDMLPLTPPGTGDPRHLIQLPPISTAANLGIAYLKKCPALDETTNNANLVVAIPEEYHDTVLIPAIQAKARESKGDARWQNAQNEFQAGLKSMLRTCRRSQATIGRLPSFFG